MQMQVLPVATDQTTYFTAWEAGQPLPWVFLFKDRMSDEHLALVSGPQQCNMYYGHSTYMQHCDDVTVIAGLDGKYGGLEFLDARTGANIESVEFSVSITTLSLDRFPGVTWHRVDASGYKFEISTQGHVLKVTEQ
jgi:hypothetical protein